MAYRISVDPAGAGLTHDLRHSVAHLRSGLDMHPGIPEKDDLGIGRLEELLNARGRVVPWIDDLHIPPRLFTSSLACEKDFDSR
jgi:hypothetical protein